MEHAKLNGNSFYFKNIYPDIKSIIDDASSYGVSFSTADFAKLFAQIMLSEYTNYEVAYDTVEAFKHHFWLTALDEIPRYEAQRVFINAVVKLSVDEISVNESTINIASFNNSSILDDPLNKLNPYVDAQNASKTTTNKFNALNSAIQSIPSMYIYEFLEKFKHHFILVITPKEYYYRREN